MLRALLLRRRDATSTSTDTDAQLELALLQLWSADGPDDVLETELLVLDAKSWQRLGLLLFASDEALVRALVAVLERVAARRDRAASRERVLRRVWRTQWRVHQREKVSDCHARLERRDLTADGDDGEGRNEDLLATRLLQILGASLRVALTTSSSDDDQLTDEPDGAVEAPKVMEVVELLLTLSTSVETTSEIARVAAAELLRLLSLEPHALSGLITRHICRSTAMQHYATWLLDDEKVSTIGSVSTQMKQPLVLNLNRVASGKLDGKRVCDSVYLDLLVAAAMMARPDANKRSAARSVVLDDTAAMLQICTLGVANPSLQHGALRLLCSLLVLDDAPASALSSGVRLSGILISISWLLGHADSHIAAMAATTLEVVIRHSPPSDILRAIIEQGCVIIYRALLSTSSGAKRGPTQAAVAASCRSLLNWVTEEVAWQTGVVAASVQSVVSSTNVLLQKNIVLTLQVLAQRSAAIREALEDQEFLTDALVMAVQADDEAGLAVSLLAASLSCCDKCSTLKICTKDNTFCCGNNEELQEEQEEVEDEEKADAADAADRMIQLRCTDGELVKVSANLLREHSNLLRGWKEERPQDQTEERIVVIARLDKYQAASVQLFVDLLPRTQQEAVSALTELQSLPTLQELLRLANAIGSAKCWHVSTAAICRMMSAANWLAIFQFASTEVRHPTLVLRCVRFALQLRSALGPRCDAGPRLEGRPRPIQRSRSVQICPQHSRQQPSRWVRSCL